MLRGTRKRSEQWELLFVLPNLEDPVEHLGESYPPGITLGSGEIAIVSSRDHRVLEIRERLPEVERLLAAFRNELGQRIYPAVLIVNCNAPSALLRGSAEPIVAFRNAAAFSYLLIGRARSIKGSGISGPTWSDTFDFHPTVVDLRGRIITVSPALISTGMRIDRFVAMPSPHISGERSLPNPDAYLLRVLGAEWKRRYVDQVDDEVGRLLFRSLETAYLACSVATRNQASLYEHGVQLGLWVSALEILAQHGLTRDVNQTDVRRLVGRYSQLSTRLNAKRFSLVRSDGSKGKEKLTAVQALANRMYQARHKFLHGSPVTLGLMMPKLGTGIPSLSRAAAVVYRYALGAYLEDRYPRLELFEHSGTEVAWELFGRATYEVALNKLLSPRGK